MKKKLFYGFAVLAIAAVATFNMGLHSMNRLSDISLANVEALARSEGQHQCFDTDKHECCCNEYDSHNVGCPCGT